MRFAPSQYYLSVLSTNSFFVSMNDYDYEKQAVESKPMVDDSLTVNLRMNFIRKVYSILSIQLLFTTLVTFLAYTNENVQIFLVTSMATLILVIIILFAVLITFCCWKNCTVIAPRNYILLSIFTACFAYIIAVTCSKAFIVYTNGAELVMVALALTCAMTFGLTMYACLTKSDFTGCGIFLFLCCICLLIASILLIFFKSTLLQVVVCVFAIVIYSLYLIFDTQRIMGGKQYELSLDNYILGSLILYMDIVMLFLELLKLLLLIFGQK